MKGYLVTAGSLLLLATASAVIAGNDIGYPGPGFVADPYGLEHPAHGHPVSPADPLSRPHPYAAPPRIHIEKAMYENGYLLRVYTESIKAEDIEVLADRGRLRLRSDMSRQSEWQSEEPYRYSRSSRRSSIARTVPLPYDADASKLTTAVKDGVLEIRIPRL